MGGPPEQRMSRDPLLGHPEGRVSPRSAGVFPLGALLPFHRHLLLPAASPTDFCMPVKYELYCILLRVFSLRSGAMKSVNPSVSSGAMD